MHYHSNDTFSNIRKVNMTENYKTRLAAATMAALSMFLGADSAMGSAIPSEKASSAETTAVKAPSKIKDDRLSIGPGELSGEDFSNCWKDSIKRLCFAGTKIGAEAAQEIAPKISAGNVTRLEFMGSDVAPDAMKIILEACCTPGAKLERLDINGNYNSRYSKRNPLIRNEETNLIVNLLENSSTLKDIAILGTALTDSSAADIAEALLLNDSLTDFWFYCNEDVTSKGIDALRAVAKNKGLDTTRIRIW